MSLKKIVETDNYDGDYPDESEVNLPHMSKARAELICEILIRRTVQDNLRIDLFARKHNLSVELVEQHLAGELTTDEWLERVKEYRNQSGEPHV